MQTINFAESNDISQITNLLRTELKIIRGKFKVLAISRTVVDSIITYVWDGILLATCGIKFTVLLRLKQHQTWSKNKRLPKLEKTISANI